ncbi:hypothetical protein DFR68_104348 [Nocardia mexicana]|uniref:Uncharacterized protein n=2 Tax=Nocardia mexicana TaxID=279262 RepID=A0A370H6L9_9NOCA|nr:hypothetical protein [Nocardia mexicana]RDI51864.1 hypothetical protein DFR68_104348 [Nocardia mexicana]
MLALVWLIDILVILVKILGGRMEVNPVLRLGLWLAFLSLLAAGFAILGLLLVLLDHWLTTLA